MLLGLAVWSFNQTLGFMALLFVFICYQGMKAVKSNPEKAVSLGGALWRMFLGR